MSTGLLSDKSYTNDQTASLVSRHRGYADLDLSLYRFENNDILPLRDIDAVKNAVRILLLTNHFDRPFQPYLGADLTGLLFEPADQFTEFCLKENITHTLERNEPRIDNISAKVQFDDNTNQYNVTLSFRVITLAQKVDMNVFLTRTR